LRAWGRRIGLCAAALAAGALAWYAPPPATDAVVMPSGRRGGDSNDSSKPRFGALPERAPIGDPRGDLFSPQTWAPPAVAAAPAPPPAPSVPPNPYSVAGSMIQEGVASVFLARGDRIFEAKPGLELDGGYRVESIASGHVVLVYVPLGVKQSLPFSSSFAAEVASSAPSPAAPQAADALPAAAGAAASAAAAESAKAAQLRWQGPESVRAGTNFSVALHLSSEQQVRAAPMQLRFEPEFLEPIGVRAGKFFGQGSFSYRMNPEGTIFVGAAGRGVAPGADAELVVLTFRPRRAGATARISVGTLALQDPSGRALAHDTLPDFRTAIQ